MICWIEFVRQLNSWTREQVDRRTDKDTSRLWRRIPRTRTVLALVCLGSFATAAGPGCMAPRTEILVWVSAEMPTSGPLSPNHLVITAWQSGQAMRHATWNETDAGPGLHAGMVVAVLYPGVNSSRSEVTVTVMPYHLGPGCAGGDGCALYPSTSPGRAIANLAPGEALLVQIPLWSTCVNVPCQSDQSCYDGTCVDAHTHGGVFDGSFPGPLDGSQRTDVPDSSVDAADPGVDVAPDIAADIAPDIVTDTGCSPGLVSCAGTCFDLQTDTNNCGACGMLCGTANDTCSGGACSCSTGTVCGSNCVDLNTDLRHCGSCGNNCQRAATGDRCRGGGCCWSPC